MKGFGSKSNLARSSIALAALSCGKAPVDAGSMTSEDTTSTSVQEPSSSDPSSSATQSGVAPTTTGSAATTGTLPDSNPTSTQRTSSRSDEGEATSGAASVASTGEHAPTSSIESAPSSAQSISSDTQTPATDVADLLSEFAVYWDFETERDGAIVDATGDAALILDGAALSQGPTGQHVAFSGPNSSAASSAVTFDTSKDLSVSAWVKLDVQGDFNTFVGVDGSSVSALFLQKRSDDRLSFATFPSDSTSATPCVTTAEIQPRDEEWYFVAATRDAATREQRIYVDGVLSGKSRCAASVFAAAGPVTVGRGLYDGQPSDWLTGGVDGLGLIQRVLTANEIVRLYRAGRPNANHYLFAYFVEVSQGRGDGLRLAHSHDGLHWGAIDGSKVFMPPSVGGGSFRDPHVMRDPKGTYHLVWTTTCVPWAESNCVQDRGLGHATSPDLVEWSAADYIEINLNVEHVWAPETIYDEVDDQYVVFWSSPLDQNPAASDPHMIYYLTTPDFQTFSEPSILYTQPGRNFIDATIRAMDDGSYLMILKDEADGQKNLRALLSNELIGPEAWTAAPSAPLTGNYAAEGPSLLARNGELYTYFDKYGEGAYGALRTTETDALDQPNSWRDISSSVFFPGVRHGTPIEVPWDVFEAVANAAGN